DRRAHRNALAKPGLRGCSAPSAHVRSLLKRRRSPMTNESPYFRPMTPRTPVKRELTSEELQAQTDAFLSRGGSIAEIPVGHSTRIEGPRSIVIDTKQDAKKPRSKPKPGVKNNQH